MQFIYQLIPYHLVSGFRVHASLPKHSTMRTKTIKIITRTVTALSLLFIIANLLVAFRMKQVYGDVWQQLGISQAKGEEQIKESFLSGYLQYYGAKNFKNLLVNDRVAVAKDLMNIAKTQVNHESFRKKYESNRNRAKPVLYPYEVKSKEEIRKQKIAESEKGIADAEALVKKMPEMEKNMRPTIDYLKKMVIDYKNPNSEMIEMIYQGELNTKEQREKSYKEGMERWQKEYPEDYRLFVKKRLQHFVDLAKTVDFNAQLKEVNGKKKFVNTAYEAKSYEWKQIFRAGKEVIAPAISFSEEWMRELGQL
jgi:hypothetical protein